MSVARISEDPQLLDLPLWLAKEAVDVRTGMARYAKTGQGSYIDSYELLDLPALRKDGEEIRIELSLSPIGPVDDADDGLRRFVLAIVRDATERKRAEETSSRLAAIVESSDDAILSKTLDGTITSWNGGAERIYGYSAAEVLGKPISILVPPERFDEVPAILERIRRGESMDHYETVRLKKDGTRINVSITVSPVRDSADLIVGASTVARDVTERKEAEEKIRCLNESLEEQVAERTAQLLDRERRLKDLVGKLVAAQEEERRRVAYEVHDGPTQVAIAAHQHLQAFADDHPPGSIVRPGELDRALELAQRAVIEARHIIEYLRPTALDDFGLAVAVRMRVEELKNEGWEIGHDDALGEERLPDEIETALYRIAQEALTNMRKHARTTRAHTRLARRGRKVVLEVRDEGRGFDPSSVSREGSPGERVGLASMSERVAMLGGEEDHKQTGRRNLSGSGGASTRVRRRPTVKNETSFPARLLIADDHVLVREGMRAMLVREPGLEVVGEAENGRQALEMCSELCPDLVLMDVRMPEMDGMAATQAIKKECTSTSVLIVTTHESPEYLMDAIRAGAAGYVLKASTKQQLLNAVWRVLGGESPLNQELAMQLLQRLIDENRRQTEPLPESAKKRQEEALAEALTESLSPRELEVSRLLALGKTNRQIAKELMISLSTVKVNVQRIITKLGVSDRTQAAVRAVECGLLSNQEE